MNPGDGGSISAESPWAESTAVLYGWHRYHTSIDDRVCLYLPERGTTCIDGSNKDGFTLKWKQNPAPKHYVLNKKTGQWIMSKNTIILLLYHCHKLLSLKAITSWNTKMWEHILAYICAVGDTDTFLKHEYNMYAYGCGVTNRDMFVLCPTWCNFF